eukprot:1802518-Rhodomonas_salina.1
MGRRHMDGGSSEAVAESLALRSQDLGSEKPRSLALRESQLRAKADVAQESGLAEASRTIAAWSQRGVA